jgi:hypothetical protein
MRLMLGALPSVFVVAKTQKTTPFLERYEKQRR